MLKKIDHLFHFTKSFNTLPEIFRYGFKPSYARETLVGQNIMVPMVSFSNILLRDVGKQEVLNYGGYAVIVERDWGIANDINPVVYTYNNGLLEKALHIFFYNSLFLTRLEVYKDKFKVFSDTGYGPFSKRISLTNTPKEVMDILDYLSTKYDEDLLIILSNHAKAIYDANFPVLTLTKPYVVTDAKGNQFIAYNDREWRKLYKDLKVLFESEDEYNQYAATKKPHFHDDKLILHFNIDDIRGVLVEKDDEVNEIYKVLSGLYGQAKIDDLIGKKSLILGTKQMLEAADF